MANLTPFGTVFPETDSPIMGAFESPCNRKLRKEYSRLVRLYTQKINP